MVACKGVLQGRHLVSTLLFCVVGSSLVGLWGEFSRSASAVTSPAGPVRAVETFDAVWRLVAKTHFDPYLQGVDWDRVREELRPLAAVAASEEELRQVIEAMLARLGQSHFQLLSRQAAAQGRVVRLAGQGDQWLQAGKGRVGFEMRVIDAHLVVSRVQAASPAQEAGVQPGWVVRSVEGQSVSDILTEIRQRVAGGRVAVDLWKEVVLLLHGRVDTGVTVGFEDGAGRKVTKLLQRQQLVREPMAEIVALEEKGRRIEAGLLRLDVWSEAMAGDLAEVMERLRDSDGMILDLRGNPGGRVSVKRQVAGYFMGGGVPLGTLRLRHGTIELRSEAVSGTQEEPYSGPLAILIDDLTASTSECFAANLQESGRARVFGRVSAGAVLPSAIKRLPNGDLLLHAVGELVTPAGTRLEGRGVVPDEWIPLTRADLLAGRDAQLAAALRWIPSEIRRGGSS